MQKQEKAVVYNDTQLYSGEKKDLAVTDYASCPT